MADANVHCLFVDEQGTVRAAKVEGVSREVADLEQLRECVLVKLAERGVKHKVREVAWQSSNGPIRWPTSSWESCSQPFMRLLKLYLRFPEQGFR